MLRKNNIDHFSPSDWVDSVRGLLPDQRASELQAHLDWGCPECSESLSFWKQLAELLAREARYEPPAPVLRAVERAYAEHKPSYSLRARARWAEQLFDSFHQPILAGVRGSVLSARHLLHEAKPFVIDLTVRTDPNHKTVRLTGQILNSENSDDRSSGAEVVLLNSDDLVSKTIATENGEFELECEAQPDLSLFINIRGQQAIGIRLPNAE
jgi:hypothetical protein